MGGGFRETRSSTFSASDREVRAARTRPSARRIRPSSRTRLCELAFTAYDVLHFSSGKPLKVKEIRIFKRTIAYLVQRHAARMRVAIFSYRKEAASLPLQIF